MIVLDTSALMAVLLKEDASAAVMNRMEEPNAFGVSAGTLVECAVVSRRRGVRSRMEALLAALAPTVIPVDANTVARIRAADARYGRGAGAAGLNFGDLFAYDAAVSRDAPLLFVGEDFTSTDIRSALEETA